MEPTMANWTSGLRRSELQILLSHRREADDISFALGLPDPKCFPSALLSELAQRLLKDSGECLQYKPPSLELKERIVELMRLRGVECSQEQIFLTAGGQQGISLLCRAMLDSDSTVVMEKYCYPGFTQAIQPYAVDRVSVDSDLVSGIDIEFLRKRMALSKRRSLMYVVAEGNNPLGYSMSTEQKSELVELAAEYKMFIMEDDPYGFLQYDSEERPPLLATDPETVLYIGSFSKILAPALRAGWLVVPKSMCFCLSAVKEAADIELTSFSQHLVLEYLRYGAIGEHIKSVRTLYKSKLEIMASSLRQLAGCVKFARPRSGVFIWADLGTGIDSMEFLRYSLAHGGVPFLPGTAFMSEQNARDSHVRLNFSYSSAQMIENGMGLMSEMLERYKAKQQR